MNRFVMAATGALVLVACSHQSEAAPETSAPASAPHVVLYAEGEGTTAGAVTMKSESGGTIQKDVALPMGDPATGQPGVSSDLFKPGDDLYISVQNKQATGSVTCRIEVDGQKIDEATSSGPYKIATCVGKVP